MELDQLEERLKALEESQTKNFHAPVRKLNIPTKPIFGTSGRKSNSVVDAIVDQVLFNRSVVFEADKGGKMTIRVINNTEPFLEAVQEIKTSDLIAISNDWPGPTVARAIVKAGAELDKELYSDSPLAPLKAF
ncbi:MAG TPA: hypothetical protein VEP90_01605 [Methylomirabilota bacterium]|nr:hypothetical protein [Methylomirabilota bacterium]